MEKENAVVVETIIEKDELTIIRERLSKVEEERDNYKNVALKRLGKLPGDAEFLGAESELSVAEQVRLELLNREVEIARQADRDIAVKLSKENAELRLAFKNQPGSSIGGDSTGSQEVKDNVFSEAQLVAMRERARRLKLDPERYIENTKLNLQKSR
jgi:hypothetical protein